MIHICRLEYVNILIVWPIIFYKFTMYDNFIAETASKFQWNTLGQGFESLEKALEWPHEFNESVKHHKHKFETIGWDHLPVITNYKPGYLLGAFTLADKCSCGHITNRRTEEKWLPISEQYEVSGEVGFTFKPN